MAVSDLAVGLRELTGLEEAWFAEAGGKSAPVVCHELLARCSGPVGSTRTEALNEIRALSLAERDWLVLQLRCRSLGDEIRSKVRCPICKEELEIRFESSDLLEPPQTPSTVELELPSGLRVGIRPLTAADHEIFASIKGVDGPAQSKAAISQAIDPEVSLPFERLSVEDRLALEESLHSLLPEAIMLDLECDSCGQGLGAPFDPVEFVFAELKELTKALLDDVHILARAYHWSETEILSLPRRRRIAYLLRIEAEADRALLARGARR